MPPWFLENLTQWAKKNGQTHIYPQYTRCTLSGKRWNSTKISISSHDISIPYIPIENGTKNADSNRLLAFLACMCVVVWSSQPKRAEQPHMRPKTGADRPEDGNEQKRPEKQLRYVWNCKGHWIYTEWNKSFITKPPIIVIIYKRTFHDRRCT